MKKLLKKLFGAPEEINGGNRCATYLYRWTILKFRGRNIYLHHFVGDDWSLDLHDHPKRFISIGLKGWYWEETPSTDRRQPHYELFVAPWIRSFAATHIHRLVVPDRDTWTLVIVLKPVRSWGFWHEGRFINWKSYVMGDDKEIADKMKGCD